MAPLLTPDTKSEVKPKDVVDVKGVKVDVAKQAKSTNLVHGNVVSPSQIDYNSPRRSYLPLWVRAQSGNPWSLWQITAGGLVTGFAMFVLCYPLLGAALLQSVYFSTVSITMLVMFWLNTPTYKVDLNKLALDSAEGDLTGDPSVRGYARDVAINLKGEFGLRKRTAANLELLRHRAKQLMIEHGVRPSHIARHLPLAVMWATVPLKEDIHAAAIMRSGNVQDLLRAVDHPTV